MSYLRHPVIRVVLLLLLSGVTGMTVAAQMPPTPPVSPVASNTKDHTDWTCRHTDGRWEHRVDTDGNLDIAVTTRRDKGHIWFGGSPGRLQMIKLDEAGSTVRTQTLKDNPDVVMAAVTLTSDVSTPAKTLAFYDTAGQGSLVIPVPNLLAVLLRSHRITVTVPQTTGKPRLYTEDVSDIPLGAGHRCGPDEAETGSGGGGGS